jgi:ubiquinone biosynthesis protein UbiJ
LRGDKPSIRIEGDVQFAAEINWLVDNVKWDVEEDLARLIGDVPAHWQGGTRPHRGCVSSSARMGSKSASAGGRMARTRGSHARADYTQP